MNSLEIAKFALEILGRSKAEINVASKEFSGLLKSVVAGKPKKEKKAFYKLYQAFLKNPENVSIQNQLKQAIEQSSCVQSGVQQIAREGEISLGQIIGNFESASKKLHLENQLMRPFKIHSIFQHAKEETVQAVRNIDFTTPFTKALELSPEQINHIAKTAIKDAAKENAILSGRLIMYPLNKLISWTFPKSFRNLFKDIIKLPKSEFGAKYYERLVSSHALEGRAPEAITVTDKTAKLNIYELIGGNSKYSCQGGFNPYFNTIEFTKEFSSLPKFMQTNFITHEELHFQQIDAVIRTFGIERYIQALKTNTLNTMKLSKRYKGISEAELKQLIDKNWAENNLEQQIRKAFENSTKAGKIEPMSAQGQKAEVYLDAIENYVSPDKGFFVTPDKQYLKNKMEEAAYREGRRAGRKAFILQNLNLSSL